MPVGPFDGIFTQVAGAQGVPSVPRYGLSATPSIRPWHYDGPAGDGVNGWAPDGHYNATAMSGTTIGKLNADADLALVQSCATTAGNILFRFEIPWRLIESTQQHPDWTHLDYFVNSAIAKNVKLHAVPWGTPRWDGTDNHGTQQPTAANFHNFVAACVSRYPYIRIWEMWNEPDGAHYYANGVSGTSYINNVLNPGFQAVKGIDASCLVVAAGTGSVLTSYVDTLKTNGGQFDVLGFHDYNTTAANDNTDFNSIRSQAQTDYGTPGPVIYWDEWGFVQGTDQSSNINAIFPNGGQTTHPTCTKMYEPRDDFVGDAGGTAGGTALTVPPEDTLTSGLSSGTPVTSLAIHGISGNLATTNYAALVYMAGDGVVHFQVCGALTSSYTANATSLPVSFTPNYSFPAGTQVIITQDSAHAPQQYGLCTRDLASKGSGLTTFKSYT